MQIARQVGASKVATTRTQVRVARPNVRASARAGNWLPGSDAPSWLPDTLPGGYGFDPCGLAKDPKSLERFTEAELIHCRWAMLGAAGVLGVELLGFGNWYDAPLQTLNGGHSTYFGAEIPFDLTTLTAIEFVAFALAETQRGAEPSHEKRCYPGIFDPAGLSKSSGYADYKLKEIKNGRLAMVACVGFFAQHIATGKTPLAALGDHLANPWVANFGTNGVSLPGFTSPV